MSIPVKERTHLVLVNKKWRPVPPISLHPVCNFDSYALLSMFLKIVKDIFLYSLFDSLKVVCMDVFELKKTEVCL